MVKMVLSRPCHPEDQFTTSILRHWASKYDETLGEHIKAQLIKNNNQPRKRQRWGQWTERRVTNAKIKYDRDEDMSSKRVKMQREGKDNLLPWEEHQNDSVLRVTVKI